MRGRIPLCFVGNLRAWSLILALAMAVCVCASCKEDESGDSGPSECVPSDEYPDQNEWPFFSECLKDPESDAAFACSLESVLLTWDTERLSVRHECIPGQCGWKFDHEFVVEDGTITLVERDTATEVSGCSCKFRGAFSVQVEPGIYEFVIVADKSAWGGEVLTRLTESIDLAASDSSQDCFFVEN